LSGDGKEIRKKRTLRMCYWYYY